MFARSSFSRWALAAAGFAGFILSGCQSTAADASPNTPRTSVVAEYHAAPTETYRVADSVTWLTATASGKATRIDTLGIGSDGRRGFAAHIELPAPLGGARLTLSLWKYGIKVLSAEFVSGNGSDGNLEFVVGTDRTDSLARALVQALDSSTSGALKGHAGIDSLLATWILASDPRADSWNDSLPVGMTHSEVVTATLLLGAKSSKSLSELARSWSLGISDDSAAVLVRLLLAEKVVSGIDTAKYFPIAEIRVKNPIAVAAGVRASGESVGVTGAFEWDDTLGLVAFEGVVTKNGKLDSSVVVYGLPVPKSSEHSAKFDGIVNLIAKSNAVEGDYLLAVTARDGLQHLAVSSVTFHVDPKLPDQPTAPSIRPWSPANKSVYSFDSISVLTSWVVSTPQGSIDSVIVDGSMANKLNDSIWTARVKLDPTGIVKTVVARALNTAKLQSTATLEITRLTDKAGPEISWVSPQDDIDVENGVAAYTVRIRTKDPSGIDTVLIAGSKPDSMTANGEYVRKVPLTTVGSPMAIVVRVVDSLKNASVSSKAITRANPATDIPPKVVLVDPASKTGTTVPFETKSVTVRWSITDFYGIDSSSVLVNGKLAKPEPDNKWSAIVDLTAGVPTSILLSVKNKNGVSGGDVVSVTRKMDSIPPSAEWIAGARSLGWDSATVPLILHVSDNDTVVSVAIGGMEMTGANGRYETKVGLVVGDNRIVAIVTDRTGLKDTLVAVVHRYPAMTIERLVPKVSDTVVSSVNASLLADWSIAAAKSVWIGDNLVVGANGHYRYSVPLSIGANTIRMKAQDSAGKTVDDSCHITRLRDSIPPELHALSGTESKTVGWEVKSITVGWAVTDENTDLQVKIANTSVTGTGSEYNATVPLSIGRNALLVWAKDKYGNEATDSVIVQRSEDAVAPTIQPASTARSVSLAWNSRRFQASWTVSDNDSIRKVTVAGRVVTPVAGVVSIDSTFDFGKFKVVVEVVDRAGNTSRDSVVLQTIVTNGESNPIGRMPDGKVWMTANMMTPGNVIIGSTTCIDGDCALGGAYTWSQATKITATCTTADCGGLVTSPLQGVCPSGWHLPDSAEWVNLLNVVAGKADGVYETSAWDKLKSNDTTWFFRYSGAGPKGTLLTTTNYYPGTDDYGFGMKGFIWSGTPTSAAQYIGSGYWLPRYNGSIVNMQNAGRGFTIAIPDKGYMPVRCVMN